MNTSGHESVLLQEVIEGLGLMPTDTVVDATINGGGHSEQIARILGEQGTLIGIDMDADALAFSRERLGDATCRIILKNGNNRHLDTFLQEEEITYVDKILFDLGMSSRQLDSSLRGFSFTHDEPLLMTFANESGEGALTAAEIVNHWEEENIADILYGYGEERYSRRIAKAIVGERAKAPITTTGQLVTIIEEAVPKHYLHGKTHPATRSFQALRITVNDEIQSFKEALEKGFAHLAPNGRILVISFHSIEDRIVKNTFKEWGNLGRGMVLTKKPIVPTKEEVKANKRARSSKLRIFQRHEQ